MFNFSQHKDKLFSEKTRTFIAHNLLLIVIKYIQNKKIFINKSIRGLIYDDTNFVSNETIFFRQSIFNV